MPRKKEKILSLEVIEVNSVFDYRPVRILKNFICKADDAEKTIQDMDIKEYWKHEKGYTNEIKSILAPAGTRNSSVVFFSDEVCVEEVKLPASIKTGTKYVYKVYDYSGDKLNTEYGTQKDAMAYLSKKIKTKYAYVTTNGKTSKIEFSPKAIADILNQQEETTSQIEIESAGRSGTTNDMIFVSIFKNCIK